MFNTERKNEKGEVEVAICPLCGLRVEFMGAPMVRCYSTGDTYELEEIIWTLKSKVPKETEYDVENIRGNNILQDFLPNANPQEEDQNIKSFSMQLFSQTRSNSTYAAVKYSNK